MGTDTGLLTKTILKKDENKMLIYDCEIIKCIPTGVRLDNYKYCDGWRDFENMGVSVIGYDTGNTLNYITDPITRFQEIVDSEKDIVGFNSKSFDDFLLKSHGIEIETTYDLLEEIRLAAFGSSDYRDTPKGFSYSLDVISKANNCQKTGRGDLAPQLWQDGKTQEVINYCLNDVKITKLILKLGLEGKLIDPNTGEFLQLRPMELK